MAQTTWKDTPELVLLGFTDVERLPIFSFLIKHKQSGLLLHYNFIVTLLNDLFGIQSRGGCACAGPYAQVIVYNLHIFLNSFARINVLFIS